MLVYDMKRAIDYKLYCLSIILMVLCITFTELDTILEVFNSKELLETGWTEKFLLESLSDDSMLFIFPILCSLPFSSSFIDEYKSGIIKFSLSRINRKTFLVSKIMTTAISGGLIILIGVIAVSILALLFFLPMENKSIEFFSNKELFSEIFHLFCRFFLYGALGAVTGLWGSTKCNSRFMAWFSAFIAEYMLVIFVERFFPYCYIVYPREWLRPTKEWPLNAWSICLWLILLSISIGGAFFKTALRRLENV